MVMKIKSNSLEARLIVVLLCLALLPCIAVSWIAHDLMFDNLRQDRISDVGRAADAKRDQLVGMLTQQNSRAQALLVRLHDQCGGKAAKQDSACMTSLLKSYLAADGALGASLHSAAGGSLSVGTAAMQAAESSAFKAGQLAEFSGMGRDRNYFIVVKDASADYRLTLTYPSSLLDAVFFPYPAELGESGETFLVDGTGYFVTRQKYASAQGHSHPVDAHPMKTCLSGQSGEVLDKDYHDADIIRGYRFVPEFGAACIMAHISQDEAFAPLRLLEQRLSIAILVLGVLLAITAVYLARRISRPLGRLTQVTRDIAAGDLKARADETGNDELAQLSASFNTMTNKLRVSAKLLEAIVEHIPVMVFVKRAGDLRIELFNRAGAELTGYPQEALIGTGNYDLWPKEQGDSFTAADRKVLASHEVTEIPEEPITRANGEIRTLRTWKVALRDEHDEPTHLLGISVDITERKRMEQELRESELRLQFTLQASHTGGWSLDLVDHRATCTPEHDRIYGYEEHHPEWTYEMFLEHVFPEDRAEVDSLFRAAIATLSNWKVECRIRRTDGAARWISAEGGVQADAAGNPVRMAGIVQDITERKQTEQEILKLNAELEQRVAERTAELSDTTTRIQTVLNTVADGIITIAQRGRVESLNPAAEQLFGYAAAEVIGHNVNMLMPEPYHAQHDGYLERYRTTGEARLIGKLREVVGRRRDGSTFPIEVAVSKMQLGDEQYFVGMVRDISLRKQAEALQTRSSQELVDFKTALDAHSIVAITDVRGTITYVNAQFCAISQYTREELLGQDHRIVNSGYHPQEFFRELWRTISQGRIWHGDIKNRAKDGTTYWVKTTIVPFLDEHGKPVRYITLRSDITERKQAEQDLIVAKEKAELANRAKDSFLATMSHEIRTPLNGMLGMLEVLSLTPLDQDQDETLKAVWDSSRSLLRIVDDILDWSKMEEGRLEISPRATAVSQLLQEVLNTYTRVASAKSLLLSQHCDARLSPVHIVDGLRLSQVLNNFVSNALKFTPRGKVELRAELLERNQSGERIRFSVKDSGIGIAPEVQQQLFQRYQQESTDTARMYGGTGLGLSICRRLVELMDGQIELTSEPGQGSTFSVILTLPVSGLPGEAITTRFLSVEQNKVTPLFEYSAEAPLVLAVDDHPINRDLLARQIKLLGLSAESAENGQVALSLWRSGRYALVITDCHMPEMDGYALTKAIRQIEADEKLPRTPIIAWTANALAEEESLCQVAGMDELLVKPANLAQLKKMLAKWLRVAGTDNSPDASTTYVAHHERVTAPIDFVELGNVVPDRPEQMQVLKDFQSHIRADRAKLFGMLERNERADVERGAHRMSGTCRMVGAMAMADACAVIEQAARVGDMEGARAGRAGLDAAYTQLETYLIALHGAQGESQ